MHFVIFILHFVLFCGILRKGVRHTEIRNFVLSYYKNSTADFHIHKVEKAFEAQKPHTHVYFQMYYIAKGKLLHFVGDDSIALSRGDMFIIPPGTVHRIEPDPEAVFYSFSFMPEFLGEQTKASRLAANFLRRLESGGARIRPKISLPAEDLFYVENCMEHILREFTEKALGYTETVHAYAVLLVTMLARAYFEEEKSYIPDSFEDHKQFVLHCISYIENNFTDAITLEEIARRSAMGKGKFCALFLKLTGYTFNRYLNLCRIKKAAEYIRQGYKITAVYGLCGYNDFSTFYRNFKAIMGVSPKAYKNTSSAL